MAIPDFQAVMLPLLRFTEDDKEHRMSETYETIVDCFSLSDEERQKLLPSGKVRVINNRVQWAKLYLVRAGLLECPKRGVIRITDRGRKHLATCPERIDMSTLMQFPEFVEFRKAKGKRPSSDENQQQIDEEKTPDELLESAHANLRMTLADDVLAHAKQASPAFFEKLVVDLLVSMGYGGSIDDAGKVVGRSGDAGIDGIIKEDRLGLDVIYVQAKKWDDVVGRPEIQKFVGALQGRQARKGVFITTSSFTAEATGYAKSVNLSLVLIDGQELADLMIAHDVGVSAVQTYTTKRVDTDYFADE